MSFALKGHEVFVVYLRLGRNRRAAEQWQSQQEEWIHSGATDGVFIASRTLEDDLGIALLAANVTKEELEDRIGSSPFLTNDVVTAEIQEVDLHEWYRAAPPHSH